MGSLLKLAVVIAIIWLVFHLGRRLGQDSSSNSQPSSKPEGEPMVKCAHCQTHVPVSEAIQQDEHYFCSEAHRVTWQKDHQS